MADCPLLASCAFYNDKMADKPALIDMFKRRFCIDNNTSCARWKVATTIGREAVPVDLYPNQENRAMEIINNRDSNESSVLFKNLRGNIYK
jgi:hypothetical protein